MEEQNAPHAPHQTTPEQNILVQLLFAKIIVAAQGLELLGPTPTKEDLHGFFHSGIEMVWAEYEVFRAAHQAAQPTEAEIVTE